MTRLLRIELLKQFNYKTFWILTILFFVAMGATTASGMEFLKWLASKGADFDGLDILDVPLYHYPDIWQNLAYISTYFKYILGIVVIINITNEFSFKTVRQNIIDGLSRKDFLISKLVFITMLSLAATLFLAVIILVTGSIYTPADDMRFMFKDSEFIIGFFLEVEAFLLFSLLIGTVTRRAGLAIGLLILYTIMLEPIVTFNLPDSLEFLVPYFPVRAINNLVKVPYQRYFLMEIRDFLSIPALVAIVAYCGLFSYLTYYLLRKRDLQ